NRIYIIGHAMHSNHNNPVDLRKKVMFTIWILAKQESYLSARDRFNLTKSTAHSIAKEITNILIDFLPNYVRYIFKRRSHDIPGVVGIIDGCYILCKLPGRVHDARIFRIDIFRRACMAFRKIFLERGDVCSSVECTSITSTRMKVFRKNFLREKGIGIIPPGGYRYKDNHSHKALQCLGVDLAMTWRLRQRGYRVMEKRENREMHDFLENHPMLLVIYSLYQCVLKTSTFPLDQLTIYIGKQCSELIGVASNFNFDSVEGTIRCTVLPPCDLFYLMLPYRVQGKLLFGLCHAWVSCELRKAFEKGYLVTSVSEIWQFRVIRFHPRSRQSLCIQLCNRGMDNVRLILYDTDSCIYVNRGEPSEYEPRTGNFLGDMTNEFESYGRGSFIESFVSGDPKFYAYVVRTSEDRRHEICKVKGITLSYKNSRIINFNSIRKLIIDEIVTRNQACAPVLVKRKFINNRYSLPYGFRRK
ncbi:hypothetical protein ALC56_02312, partial [Trachymyrmex septentrionalis]